MKNVLLDKENFNKVVKCLISFHRKSIFLRKETGLDLYEIYDKLLFDIIDTFINNCYDDQGSVYLFDFIYDESEYYDIHSEEFNNILNTLYMNLKKNLIE